MKGLKFDGGKPRPARCIAQFLEILDGVEDASGYGHGKYSEPNKLTTDNWRYVENGIARYMGAFLRHYRASFMALDAARIGDWETFDKLLYDEESGKLHTGHLAWNGLALGQLLKDELMEAMVQRDLERKP